MSDADPTLPRNGSDSNCDLSLVMGESERRVRPISTLVSMHRPHDIGIS